MLLQEGMRVFDPVTELWITGLMVEERFPKEAVSLVTPGSFQEAQKGQNPSKAMLY